MPVASRADPATLPVDRVRAEAQRLDAAWRALPDGRPRRALDPLALGPRLLPHVNLLSRIAGADGDDFRYDLVGQVLRVLVPRLTPGALAGDVARADSSRTFILDRLRTVAATGRPGGFEVDYVATDWRPVASIATIHPLDLTAGGAAGSLLVGVWSATPGAAARDRTLAIDDLAAWLDGHQPGGATGRTRR